MELILLDKLTIIITNGKVLLKLHFRMVVEAEQEVKRMITDIKDQTGGL